MAGAEDAGRPVQQPRMACAGIREGRDRFPQADPEGLHRWRGHPASKPAALSHMARRAQADRSRGGGRVRTIAHLSDLHFGRVAPETLSPLRDAVASLRPDLVAVSGDLTQRARKRQFQQARDFLDSLPGPQVVVPGNHDVPLYNVLARWLWPLENYRRHIE